MFELGVELLPFHDFGLEESLQTISSLGYEWVNLWSARPPLPNHVNPGDDPGQVRNLLDRYGLKASALSLYGKTPEEMAERIEFAREVGIDTVVFDCEANFADFVGTILPKLLQTAEHTNVRIAVENHITVPFTEDFETASHEGERWEEGVDSLAQIKRLITALDSPYLGVCLAPPHLWVMDETISEAISYLCERNKLFFYYIWDIDRDYRRGIDGLNFGSGENQLPRPGGTLNHAALFRQLQLGGYDGIASVCFHGTAGWPLEKVKAELARATSHISNASGVELRLRSR